MMIDYELIKNIVSMFVLNSLWETLAYSIFILYDNKKAINRNILISQIVFLSLVNSILYNTMPPILFQIINILLIILMFRKYANIPIKKVVISFIKYFAFVCIFEGLITISLIYFIGVDLRDIKFGLMQLLYGFPIKLLELIIIYYYKRKEVQLCQN